MPETINIYGVNINLPECDSVIEDWGVTDPKEQYWRRKELPNLFKEKPEVQLYIDDSYPDEDDKQQLLLMLSKVGSLDNLKEIESIKSIF